MTGNAARVQAIQQITNRTPIKCEPPIKLEEAWATNVFDLSKMQASLQRPSLNLSKTPLLPVKS